MDNKTETTGVQVRPAGESHPHAIYTAEQVAEAKRLLSQAKRVSRLAPGELKTVADQTGISPATVHAIAYGRAWKHSARADEVEMV